MFGVNQLQIHPHLSRPNLHRSTRVSISLSTSPHTILHPKSRQIRRRHHHHLSRPSSRSSKQRRHRTASNNHHRQVNVAASKQPRSHSSQQLVYHLISRLLISLSKRKPGRRDVSSWKHFLTAALVTSSRTSHLSISLSAKRAQSRSWRLIFVISSSSPPLSSSIISPTTSHLDSLSPRNSPRQKSPSLKHRLSSSSTSLRDFPNTGKIQSGLESRNPQSSKPTKIPPSRSHRFQRHPAPNSQFGASKGTFRFFQHSERKLPGKIRNHIQGIRPTGKRPSNQRFKNHFPNLSRRYGTENSPNTRRENFYPRNNRPGSTSTPRCSNSPKKEAIPQRQIGGTSYGGKPNKRKEALFISVSSQTNPQGEHL